MGGGQDGKGDGDRHEGGDWDVDKGDRIEWRWRQG